MNGLLIKKITHPMPCTPTESIAEIHPAAFVNARELESDYLSFPRAWHPHLGIERKLLPSTRPIQSFNFSRNSIDDALMRG